MDVLIVDDDRYVLEKVSVLLKKYEADTGHIVKTRKAISYEELRIELANSIPDLIILDIELQDKNGIEIKNELEKEENYSLIVFLTNYAYNMKEAFGKNVVGFFEKPLDYNTLSLFMERVIGLIGSNKMVELEKNSHITTRKIRYIQVKDIYTDVYISDGHVICIRRSLGDWYDKLSDVGFIRISNKCLVNCAYISGIEGDFVFLEKNEEIGEERLQISRRRKKECMVEYEKYRRKMARYVK